MSVRQAHLVTGVAVDHKNREKDDFYPTPPRGTQALLSVEKFCGPIWEPACGDGAISRVLEDAGYKVISTDLVDRGYGTARRDFLMECALAAPNVVTNPPFKLATQFMRHAWSLGAQKMAFLLRLTCIEGSERGEFYDASQLARIWAFRSRLTISRSGAPLQNGSMIAMAWFVWDRAHSGPPTLGWLP